jgi:hypothetical protein
MDDPQQPQQTYQYIKYTHKKDERGRISQFAQLPVQISTDPQHEQNPDGSTGWQEYGLIIPDGVIVLDFDDITDHDATQLIKLYPTTYIDHPRGTSNHGRSIHLLYASSQKYTGTSKMTHLGLPVDYKYYGISQTENKVPHNVRIKRADIPAYKIVDDNPISELPAILTPILPGATTLTQNDYRAYQTDTEHHYNSALYNLTKNEAYHGQEYTDLETQRGIFYDRPQNETQNHIQAGIETTPKNDDILTAILDDMNFWRDKTTHYFFNQTDRIWEPIATQPLSEISNAINNYATPQLINDATENDLNVLSRKIVTRIKRQNWTNEIVVYPAEGRIDEPKRTNLYFNRPDLPKHVQPNTTFWQVISATGLPWYFWRQVIGQALITDPGETMRLRRMVFIYGQGGKGKSTFVNFITSIFSRVTDVSPRDLAKEFSLADLDGSIINIAEESKVTFDSVESEIIKGLVTGQNYTLNPKFGRKKTQWLNPVLLFTTNSIPSIPDAPEFQRRIVVANFTGKTYRVIPNIIEKLYTPENIAFLIDEALAGKDELQANGWKFPTEVIDALYKSTDPDPIVEKIENLTEKLKIGSVGTRTSQGMFISSEMLSALLNLDDARGLKAYTDILEKNNLKNTKKSINGEKQRGWIYPLTLMEVDVHDYG